MCFFKKKKPAPAPTTQITFAPQPKVNDESTTFTFEVLPKTLEELKARPEASLDSPFKTAALTLCALCAYGEDREAGKEMLNFLRGPRPLSAMDISFLNDRFMDGQTYVPYSYFNGATPANNYTPAKPFTVTFFKDAYSDRNDGYMRLNVRSGGADSPRQLTLRKVESTGQWFLWEQSILVGIRTPKAADPWA